MKAASWLTAGSSPLGQWAWTGPHVGLARRRCAEPAAAPAGAGVVYTHNCPRPRAILARPGPRRCAAAGGGGGAQRVPCRAGSAGHRTGDPTLHRPGPARLGSAPGTALPTSNGSARRRRRRRRRGASSALCRARWLAEIRRSVGSGTGWPGPRSGPGMAQGASVAERRMGNVLRRGAAAGAFDVWPGILYPNRDSSALKKRYIYIYSTDGPGSAWAGPLGLGSLDQS